MRKRYDRQAGDCQISPGWSGTGVIPLEWRQDWFTNLCLAVILAVILFLMLLSIYLVFSKSEPAATPSPKQTGAMADGSAFAAGDLSDELSPETCKNICT